MITELEPQAFLDKLAEASARTAAPVRVEILRQPVPVYVAVGDHSEPRDAVLVVYQFQYGSDEYLAREHALFNDSGEADLGRLRVWPQLRRLGIGGVPPANDPSPPESLRNVRPVLVHRSGSV